MKKITILFLAILFIVGLGGCASRTIRFDIGNVSKITVFSGSTGEKIEITDISTIDRITTDFNAISFSKDFSSKGYDGYSYQITWYDVNGEQTEIVTVMNSTRISYSGYFYDSMKDGDEIDIDFIKELMEMGTDTSGTYEISVNDPENYLYEQLYQFSPSGEQVVIKTHILHDVDLECFVNGKSIGKQTAIKTGDDYTHWEFYFEMPAEDVTITFKTVEVILG